MKRLGFFTGRIYDESTPVKDIKECCYVLRTREELIFGIDAIKACLKESCAGCYGCEEARCGLSDNEDDN